MTRSEGTRLPATATLHQTIAALEDSEAKIVLVIDDDCRLLGTVTDGDIRRSLLKSVSLDEPVASVMNENPDTLTIGETFRNSRAIMAERGHRYLPLVDAHGRVAGLESLEIFGGRQEVDNWVVVMAGGLGSRLEPLTNDRPKPLLEVGDKPILETILQQFLSFGFRQFYFSVNYKRGMVEDYFKDGADWNCAIRYLREDKPLGTAGALKLLPETPSQPIIVTNGDILTTVNYLDLLQFHHQHQAAATMCVVSYNLNIPYGIVEIEDHRFVGIEEKPVYRSFVNAGIYVFEPQTLDYLPDDTRIDMPLLFNELKRDKEQTVVFPIREYWLDVGRAHDLDRARSEFRENFS